MTDDDRQPPPPPQFELDAGRLCLDFANTLGVFAGDHLHGPQDLLAFARQAGLVPDTELPQLLADLRDQPEAAHALLARARTLRQAIFDVFSAVVARRPAAAPDLATLNDELAATLGQQRLVAEPDGSYDWGWRPGRLEPADLLRPIVRSAADLLTSPDLAGVRQCAASDCAWLFLDTSRNRSRQWCSMQTCGNRAKARRYYERRRRTDAPASA
ncbi:MAG: ABATE domain-containing protein [Chloroflexi bacterium]|nr:ABATE domain-containing protein [Chloroflexota bacterium]